MEGINNAQKQPFGNFELGNIKKKADQMNINSMNDDITQRHFDSYNDQYIDDD